jgi:hypothetical protein
MAAACVHVNLQLLVLGLGLGQAAPLASAAKAACLRCLAVCLQQLQRELQEQ